MCIGRRNLTSFFTTNNFSDSSTQAKSEDLRFLETTVRTLQIQKIYSTANASEDVDAKTKEFISRVIAPAIEGEVVIIPALNRLRAAIKDFVENFGRRFAEGMGKAIGEHASKNPPQPPESQPVP